MLPNRRRWFTFHHSGRRPDGFGWTCWWRAGSSSPSFGLGGLSPLLILGTQSFALGCRLARKRSLVVPEHIGRSIEHLESRLPFGFSPQLIQQGLGTQGGRPGSLARRTIVAETHHRGSRAGNTMGTHRSMIRANNLGLLVCTSQLDQPPIDQVGDDKNHFMVTMRNL